MSVIKSILKLPFTSISAVFYGIRGLFVTGIAYYIGLIAGDIASELLANWLEPNKWIKATGLASQNLTHKELYFWTTHAVAIIVLFLVTEALSRLYKMVRK